MSNLVPSERIESKIFLIRGQKVMIDRDIAMLYGVETKYLTRQVMRNIERFPEEFMFRLTKKEKTELVTNWHHLKPLKYSYRLPIAFTEHGVAMLASVLKSERAIKISILIIKTFVKLRQLLSTHKELAKKLQDLEKQVGSNTKDIRNIFQAIRKLMAVEGKPGKMGFVK